MARPINNDNLLKISQALNEANASEVRGLSIPEIAEATGIDRFAVMRIIKRPEFGFCEAAAKSNTGATTYYHDLTQMMLHQPDDNNVIQPLMFESEERTKFVLTNLLNAIMVVDPTNKLVAAVGNEMAEKSSKGRGKSQQKDYFDWLMYPFKSDLIQWLTENRKAKDKTDKFFKDIEEWKIEQILNTYLYHNKDVIWDIEKEDFRPEMADKKWQVLVSHACDILMCAAYIKSQEDKEAGETDKESSITSG